MDYEKTYYDYIAHVKTLNRSKDDGIYYERHHIIPRSLGGLDTEENLVLLTAKEHYYAHYFLWKFNPCRQTAYAFYMMNTMISSTQKRYINARLYEESRKAFNKYNRLPRKHQSKEQIENRIKKIKGKKRTLEQKQKIINGIKKFYDNETEEQKEIRINKVKEGTKKAMWRDDVRQKYLEAINSDEVKEKRKDKLRQYWEKEENHKKFSDACKGRKISEETKKKISKTLKGKKWSDDKKKDYIQKLHNSDFYKKKHQESLDRKEERRLLILNRKKERKNASIKKLLEKEEILNKSNLKWWNNGIKNTRAFDSPGPEWKRGKLCHH